jgi:murein DD-endopeptidase MepM/ murein hydrolase activator NlpD
VTIQGPKEAAAGLEAYFLRRVLAEVGPGEALAGSGIAGSTFHDMLNEALADSMAKAGGVGLADQIAAQLFDLPANGAAPARSAAGALARYHGAGALSVRPVEGDVTWQIGDRVMNGRHQDHKGVDMVAPAGTPIRAAGEGRVIRAEAATGYGNLVVIDHGGGLETRYAHLSRIDVRPGDVVPAGVVLGAAGETGNARNPHLHFEVRRDGVPVDPERELPHPSRRGDSGR